MKKLKVEQAASSNACFTTGPYRYLCLFVVALSATYSANALQDTDVEGDPSADALFPEPLADTLQSTNVLQAHWNNINHFALASVTIENGLHRLSTLQTEIDQLKSDVGSLRMNGPAILNNPNLPVSLRQNVQQQIENEVHRLPIEEEAFHTDLVQFAESYTVLRDRLVVPRANQQELKQLSRSVLDHSYDLAPQQQMVLLNGIMASKPGDLWLRDAIKLDLMRFVAAAYVDYWGSGEYGNLPTQLRELGAVSPADHIAVHIRVKVLATALMQQIDIEKRYADANFLLDLFSLVGKRSDIGRVLLFDPEPNSNPVLQPDQLFTVDTQNNTNLKSAIRTAIQFEYYAERLEELEERVSELETRVGALQDQVDFLQSEVESLREWQVDMIEWRGEVDTALEELRKANEDIFRRLRDLEVSRGTGRWAVLIGVEFSSNIDNNGIADDVDHDGLDDAWEDALLQTFAPVLMPDRELVHPYISVERFLSHSALMALDENNRVEVITIGADFDLDHVDFTGINTDDVSVIDDTDDLIASINQWTAANDRICWIRLHPDAIAGGPGWSEAEAIEDGVGVYGRVTPITSGTPIVRSLGEGQNSLEDMVCVQYYILFSANQGDVRDSMNFGVETVAGAFGTDFGDHYGDILCLDLTIDITNLSEPKILYAIMHNHGHQFILGAHDLTLRNESHPVLFLEQRSHEPWPVPQTRGHGLISRSGTFKISLDLGDGRTTDTAWFYGSKVRSHAGQSNIVGHHTGQGVPYETEGHVQNLGERGSPRSEVARFLLTFPGGIGERANGPDAPGTSEKMWFRDLGSPWADQIEVQLTLGGQRVSDPKRGRNFENLAFLPAGRFVQARIYQGVVGGEPGAAIENVLLFVKADKKVATDRGRSEWFRHGDRVWIGSPTDRDQGYYITGYHYPIVDFQHPGGFTAYARDYPNSFLILLPEEQ